MGRALNPFPPFARPLSELCSELGTDLERGLDPAAAATRLQEVGPNRLAAQNRPSPWRHLLVQFNDALVLLLLGAALVAIVVGEPQDAVAILVIVVINAALGAVQSWRADRALAQLERLAAPGARVRRGGRVESIPSELVVPGDVVLVEAGDWIPADVRIAEAIGVAVDESALTGESYPVEKRAGVIPAVEIPIGDRWNMIHRGCYVTRGRAIGVVVASGTETEVGRISLLLGPEAPTTPLQRRLAALGRRLAAAVLAICAVVFVVGLVRGEPAVLVLLTAISLAVAAIPEALPAIVSIALALGARRMSRRAALVRHLPAVETLGSVTVICTDKTGTLTRSEMAVARYWVVGAAWPEPPANDQGPVWGELFRAIALNNDAVIDGAGSVSGDPTEIALRRAAADRGFERKRLELAEPRVEEFGFTSERGRMTTLHRVGGRLVALTKGSPEAVIGRCTAVASAGLPISVEQALAAAREFAADGLRVLAIATRGLDPIEKQSDPDLVERQMTLLGLIGLDDPPRPEVAGAIEQCRAAGIVPIMITGDHPETARAVARAVGLLEPGDEVMTGTQLSTLGPGDLGARLERIRVFARVAPEQKLRIVEALQAKGQLVAMTGDGVNDAPALKRADIGVAMGRRGTEVARGAADLVLLDDNFATIVAAVRAGRQIYDNIRKFVRFVLTGNAGEILTLVLAPILGLPIPLLPIHILWINLVTDGLPGIALTLERAEPNVMRRPPRPPDESVFARGLGTHVGWVGLLIGAVTLFGAAWTYRSGSSHWQSVAFTVLALAQLAHVMGIRSERESILTIGWFSNRPLFIVVAATVAVQIGVLYYPAAQRILHTQPLTSGELAMSLALASLALVAAEGEKWVIRRREPHPR